MRPEKKKKKKEKKKRYYVVLQGGELTCFHFFGSSCSIDRGLGAPWYFQEVFPPVGGQVVFLSREAPVVGVIHEPGRNCVRVRSRTSVGLTTSHLCTDFPMRGRVILTS